ncbi:T9SS type A sorting domain-containing protein [Hymenobacter swuensis]|uniref:T9SS type A sorting domain-containing protein n=1 Tax=Hymenobacter swuensis TaxID=1446467 RepID=UPI0009DDDA62|nr:T9SS type A sorting domain-containing protein [Hymenobacter swuensis]
MKRTCTIFFVLLCVAFFPSAVLSQVIWTHQYELPTNDRFGASAQLRDGGFLLSGTNFPVLGGQYPRTPTILLVRTDTQGDTLWTRKQRIRKYADVRSTFLCENTTGHVLMGGYTVATTTYPNLDYNSFLTLFTPTGDTLWTKELPLSYTNTYKGITLGPDGNFVIAANVQGHPQLQSLGVNGQVVWQTTLDFSATEAGRLTAMTPVPNGYLVVLQAADNSKKFVYVSHSGVRGAEYLNANSLDELAPNRLVAVEDGNIAVVQGTTVRKFSPDFTLLWSATTPSNQLSTIGMAIVRNTSGQYVVTGNASSSSHNVSLVASTYSAQGQYLSTRTFYSTLNLGTNNLLGNLHIDRATGEYVVAGSGNISNGTSSSIDYFLTKVTGAPVLASLAAARRPVADAYPNPVTSTRQLTVVAPGPLSGQLLLINPQGQVVRQWPIGAASPGNRYTLSLAGLPAGLYFLRLTDASQQSSTVKIVVP